MREWWRDAVVYQIYPRSYQDDNGDGIGDFPGIIRRLDHIASLGADAIWLSPFFTSPDKDMGYDVSDYTGVNPIFGTIEDFDSMVTKAHDLGLKVIIDQVISHTSDQHPWFEESRQNRTNPKADWYVWADPNPDGSPPSNWISVFGGSAWAFDPRRRQYYLHNFLAEQPDLNFHNPDVVDALIESMRFWLERGVDGFRLDTVNYYVHDQQFRDNPPEEYDEFPLNPYGAQDHIYAKTRPENIAVLKRLRALTDEFDDRMMVGEVGEGHRSIDVMAEYTAGNDRLHMAYSFEFLGDNHKAGHFQTRIAKFFAKAPDGWPCWSFSNHDVPRHVTRWAKTPEHEDAVARQSIALLCSFPGTLGIYQGEELGQTETDIEFHELQDLGNVAFWPETKGRDGCRTPMVWEKDAPNAGFSSGTPWLPVKSPQAAKAVDGQELDPDSVLHHYRKMLTFRRNSAALCGGAFEFHALPEPIFGIRRMNGESVITAVFNLSDVPVDLHLTGIAVLAGPGSASLNGASLHLPAYGYAFLEEDGALSLEPRREPALA